MKKKLPILFIIFSTLFFVACNSTNKQEAFIEKEKYDGPAEIDLLEFEKTKDPLLNSVPMERLWSAMNYTQALKQNFSYDGVTSIWEERGPIFDSVGPSNNNSRGGPSGFTGAYTSGRIRGFLVDAADTSGNTIFCGGVNGGIWKCTNFMSATNAPNWVQVNDFLSNMSIVSFCQNPANNDIIYVSTGEANNNSDAVRGNGIFKSIDHGATWTHLSATAGMRRSFKIVCDNAGNLYYATSGSGLLRSLDGGGSFASITPTGAGTICTDIEISSTGRLHASFGFGGTSITYKYTTSPSTVTTSTWSSGSGIRPSGATARRFEIATLGDVIYGVTTNSSNDVDSCYKSTNGGKNWSLINNTALPNIANTQGWYDLSLAVNPNNSNEIICGGVDAYLSSNAGETFNRLTYWVGNGNYVHADHHQTRWWNGGGNNPKMIIASDGGLYYSNNNGNSFVDKNKNLGIKQFYSCAIHPNLTNYFLGGAQDNGVHQLKNSGLSYSTEVTGGDGAFVDIDNDQPQYQFGSYVYNNYRRSSNGGNTWSSFSFSSSTGSFINPWDYDDTQNIILGANTNNDFFRWTDPQTAASAAGATTSVVTLTELSGKVTAVSVSPYKTGRAFFGSNNGNIVKVENSKTTNGSGGSDVQELNSPLNGVYTSCIAIGTNDSNLLAVYSNYGISSLFITNNMGNTWTDIEGNLPDMPVRWAVFHPTINNAIVIGTEAGVFTTTNVNGASTVWTPSPGFPLVRVDMLKLRKSDNCIIAATHGRGMWASNILNILPLKKITLNGKLELNDKTLLSWTMVDATNNVKYNVEYSEDGVKFNNIAKFGNETYAFNHSLKTDIGYYRVMGYEPNKAPIYSNTIVLRSIKNIKGISINILPNPIKNNGRILVSSTISGTYLWRITNIQGNILQSGKSVLQNGLVENLLFNSTKLNAGMYVLNIIQNNQTKSISFIKE